MKNTNFMLALLAGSAIGVGIGLALSPKRREKLLAVIKESEELQNLKEMAINKFAELKEELLGDKKEADARSGNGLHGPAHSETT